MIAALRRPSRRPRLRWWREVLYVVAVYSLYSYLRNQFGSEAVSPDHAFDNARIIIAIERAVGLYFEENLQDWYLALPRDGLIELWNFFYGSFHFVVTPVALIWLYRHDPQRYPRWRNTLAFTTILALVGFASFALMPPRLLDDCETGFGACRNYGYVDTLRDMGGLWSFDDSTLRRISNQYAAMPSLHIVWAVWSALVMYPMVRRQWARGLLVAYPWLTLFAIVVTANHYWLDAVGSLVVLGAGYVIGSWLSLRVGPSARHDVPDPARER